MKKTQLKDMYGKQEGCHYQVFINGESAMGYHRIDGEHKGKQGYLIKDATIHGYAMECGDAIDRTVKDIPLCRKHADYISALL